MENELQTPGTIGLRFAIAIALVRSLPTSTKVQSTPNEVRVGVRIFFFSTPIAQIGLQIVVREADQTTVGSMGPVLDTIHLLFSRTRIGRIGVAIQ